MRCENDVNLRALGEPGPPPDQSPLLYIKVSSGIGGGLVGSGELYHGADGSAGDIGHVRVTAPTRCSAAAATTAASRPWPAARHRGGLKGGRRGELERDGDVRWHLSRQGNLLASQVVRQAGRDIGEVLQHVRQHPQPFSHRCRRLNLGEAGEQLIAGMREVVYRRSLPLATTHLRIGLSMAGDQAAILGASQMVTQFVLSPAVIEATLQAAG